MRKSVIAIAAVAAALGISAPASADDPILDVEAACNATIGSGSQEIDLRPVAYAIVWTCSEADFEH